MNKGDEERTNTTDRNYGVCSVQPPLNASASSAGKLLSSFMFEVPQFQREYSWARDEVTDFWNDLKSSIEADSYFLGLVILTDKPDRKFVVDGQQRLITLTLLASAIYFEAKAKDRRALAERIQADFIRSIDYDTDETNPRLILSDEADNETFQSIIATGEPPPGFHIDDESISRRVIETYDFLRQKLREDLRIDPFKRLGKWADFLTNRLYFAVFIHPDASSAYQVYEVINTRGKELTTADLLKNYVLSQTPDSKRAIVYEQWKRIARQFTDDGASFVQFIRHAVTVESGHILPKDLFGFLAGRVKHFERVPPTPSQLIKLLERHLPLYRQMMDPTLPGPARPEALGIFSALNALGVIAVRPILLATADVPDPINGMRYVLQLVVRRIVVGSLGTGNIERRFGEAAKSVFETGSWEVLRRDLKDLNPGKDDFIIQLSRRSFKKAVLAFLRRSIISDSIIPDEGGTLHFIWTPQFLKWVEMTEEEGAYWGATIGNTFLSTLEKRPSDADTWAGFKRTILPSGINGEWSRKLDKIKEWNAGAVETMGSSLAQKAGDIWY
ncbi:DUF262 domain-containing protein [Xanthobacteraceae bacterium Astr-EGSB]|uniref:DUF262 domain-containing protein n=1 Tax=Astrobacterium formosum TaxID=3069710 RepID=UPI0027AE7E27|nr:DUF262 domain-containing protein [Xanthobacteraceae bacterium Astr-EGSB]